MFVSGMSKLHPSIVQLLADIETFRMRTGIDKTNFGLKAASDGHFITRVMQGKIPRVTTIDRVYKYMEAHGTAVRPNNHTVITRKPK